MQKKTCKVKEKSGCDRWVMIKKKNGKIRELSYHKSILSLARVIHNRWNSSQKLSSSAFDWLDLSIFYFLSLSWVGDWIRQLSAGQP